MSLTPLYSRHVKEESFKSASETPKENENSNSNNNEDSAKAAVDNWFSLYRNVPEAHKAAFRKSLELSKTKPQLFTRLFASDSEVNLSRESQDVLKIMKDKLASLEGTTTK